MLSPRRLVFPGPSPTVTHCRRDVALRECQLAQVQGPRVQRMAKCGRARAKASPRVVMRCFHLRLLWRMLSRRAQAKVAKAKAVVAEVATVVRAEVAKAEVAKAKVSMMVITQVRAMVMLLQLQLFEGSRMQCTTCKSCATWQPNTRTSSHRLLWTSKVGPLSETIC
ncbi:unnamed protein product [Symbiodinium sp. CCMP2592]|nr:unnamed protein product [Symbiodinium sp. CCMP2592]